MHGRIHKIRCLTYVATAAILFEVNNIAANYEFIWAVLALQQCQLHNNCARKAYNYSFESWIPADYIYCAQLVDRTFSTNLKFVKFSAELNNKMFIKQI